MDEPVASLAARVANAMLAFRSRQPATELEHPADVFFTMSRWQGRPVAQPMVWFASRGCRHMLSRGGCTMCDFGTGKHSWNDILSELDVAFAQLQGSPIVHLAAPGSFLDDAEVPPDVRSQILHMATGAGARVIGFEARPEHIRGEALQAIVSQLADTDVIEVCVGTGVEVYDDAVGAICVGKGSSRTRAAEALAEVLAADARTPGLSLVAEAHVLLKPPAFTETEAIEDATAAISWCFSEGFTTVILMPCSAKPTTPLGLLARAEFSAANSFSYEPPSLWSVLEVLSRVPDESLHKIKVHGFASNTDIGMRPTSCPKCEGVVVALIQQFNATGSRYPLEAAAMVGCSCKEGWRADLEGTPETELKERLERFVAAIEQLAGVGEGTNG